MSFGYPKVLKEFIKDFSESFEMADSTGAAISNVDYYAPAPQAPPAPAPAPAPAGPIELLKPVSTANPSHTLTGHPLLGTSNYNNEGIMMQVPTGQSWDSTSSFRAPPMVGAQNLYRRNLTNDGTVQTASLPDDAYTRSQGQWVKFFADGTYEAFNGTSTGTGTWTQVAF